MLRMFIVLVLNVLSYVATTEGRSGGFYAYKVKDIKGNQVALEMYKGKVCTPFCFLIMWCRSIDL